MRRSGVAALLAAVLSACGDADDPRTDGGCHYVALGTCSVYLAGAPSAFNEAGCTRTGGVWVASCPVEGSLGTCVFSGVFPDSYPNAGAAFTASETFYPGTLATPEEFAATCAAWEGEFTAGTAQAAAPTEQAFSCDRRSADGTCSDYSGLWEPERRAAFEWVCTTWDGGTLLPAGTACPAAGRTGTCRTTIGAVTRIEVVREGRAVI